LDERALLGSVVQSAKKLLATTTLLVFHAASAVADGMALAQAYSLPIALNLALRIVMVLLLAAFHPRRPPSATP
jgi:hypothetical protein